MTDTFETVYTMTDFWDGPRQGIADYHGSPHIYQSIFDDKKGEWSNVFLLKPIDSETFKLALEAWQIWLRGERAFYSGENNLEKRQNPALSQDRKRRDELEVILKPLLQVDLAKSIRAQGQFKIKDGVDKNVTGWKPLLVAWFEDHAT